MILQALKKYYERMKDDYEAKMPEFGYSREAIHYELLIDKDGNLDQVNSLIREIKEEGKSGNAKTRYAPTIMNVPSTTETDSRSGQAPPPNFLWDNSGFVLGNDAKGKPEKAQQKHERFIELHKSIARNYSITDDEGMAAVLKFLDKWDSSKSTDLDQWEEISKGANLVFRLEGDKQRYIHERPRIVEAWKKYFPLAEEKYSKDEEKRGKEKALVISRTCLLTGEVTNVARIHRKISGVRYAQPTGAAIVSFNENSYISYGKEQNLNSPISIEGAFAYTTALNSLLANERRKIQIGDATTVFWADKQSPVEDWFAEMFNPQQEDTSIVNDVRNFLEAVREGKMPKEIDTKAMFYILGLSPNASRLAARFWYAGTVGELSERIGRHFKDISIEKQHPDERDFPALWQLLKQTAVLGKMENVSPLLGGELARSILTGCRYPESMLSTLIGRIRATNENENQKKITYLRIAMIKGILVRNHGKEVSMSLDKGNKEQAYLLGRLFAVMEKAQQDALGDINATIKDKYYSSASSTPCSAFPILLKLNKHHTSKGEHGRYYDSLNAEILEQLPAKKFPSHLSLENQGLFAVGYYHQRNDFFKKKEV